MCRCLKKRYEEEQARDLSAILKVGEESFADFSLDYAGGSGKLQSKLSTQMRDGKYVRGDGIAEFSVASGSGNLLLLPYTE